MKNFFLFSVLAFTMSFAASCGGDDVDCMDPNINQNWADEFQAVMDSGTTYAADPTSDNCNTYKDALQAYLDVIKDYEDCADTAQEQEEFNEAITEAQAVINTLQC